MKLKLLSYLIFLLTFLILNSCSGQVVKEPQKKLALLIANQDYQGRDRLYNPIADAQGIATALKRAGFTSFVYTDLSSKQDMETAFNSFLTLLDDDDIAWFYYAGHGVQYQGKSYLIPTQADIPSSEPEQLPKKAMLAQDVMKILYEKGHRKNQGINLIVLDTCRDDSYTQAEELKEDLVGVGGGNVMVVFSTKAGEKSGEGRPGKNGPLAKALIEGIKQWHWQPLEDVLQSVGEGVRKGTAEQQQVYVYGWVGKPFCLSRCLGTQNITITP